MIVTKVLEKVVAARLGLDVDHFGLIPPSQFGSHHYHSTTDAATMLRYKVETTIKAGRVGAILLMDISRFFDSLRPSIMSHILRHLGVDEETVGWVHSLMADRTVRIQVKDFSLEGFQPGNSTPQGSPASPILSALFTIPLL
jgi:Reverse transcriptase (RNA-dependent DNA polymerase)